VNKYRSAQLWIGLAALAAIALLAIRLWASSQRGGTGAPETNHDDVADAPVGDQHAARKVGHAPAASDATAPAPKKGVVGKPEPAREGTPEQQEARALTAKRYKAAQHSPNRLEWAPEEVRPSNMVFDLCDDVQAREAGLAINALNEDRHNLGVDCKTSAHRFAYIPPNEAMRFANSYEEANALLEEFAKKGSIKGEKFDKPVGTLMGHRGPWPVDIGLALDPCGTGFGCAAASINVSRGATRGVFANVSDEVAHNVTISAGNVVARYPLSVQPGESSAFVLPAELSYAELATLNITATFAGKADPRRAVLLMGAPGAITAPRAELAKRYFGIAPAGGPDVITYFVEALMLENSTTHPDAAQSLPNQTLDAPIAVVALLDEHFKVIEVLQLPVTLDETGKPVPVSSMAFVKTYTIGFVMPPEVGQSFISVGGAE
jgi:hypothetical protein